MARDEAGRDRSLPSVPLSRGRKGGGVGQGLPFLMGRGNNAMAILDQIFFRIEAKFWFRFAYGDCVLDRPHGN